MPFNILKYSAKLRLFQDWSIQNPFFCEISPLFYISSIDYQRGDQRCPKSMVYNSGKAIFNFLLFSTISNFCPHARHSGVAGLKKIGGLPRHCPLFGQKPL